MSGHAPQPSSTIFGVEGVTDVAYHPDGTMLVSSGTDGKLALWDAEMGVQLFAVEEERAIMAVDFSPDGAQLAAAGEDGTVNVWQVDPVAKVLTLDLNLAVNASDVAFGPNGRFLATSSGTGDSALWEAASGRQVQQFFGHSGAVLELQFMPDGTQLVTAGEDRTIKLWDLALGSELMTVAGVMNPVFTPNGRFIATANLDGTMTLWDPESGVAAQQFDKFEIPITAVAFNAEVSMLATTTVDNSITVWSFPELDPILQIPPQPERVWHVQFSPNDNLIAISNELGMVNLWDVANGKIVFEWQASPSPNTNKILSWSQMEKDLMPPKFMKLCQTLKVTTGYFITMPETQAIASMVQGLQLVALYQNPLLVPGRQAYRSWKLEKKGNGMLVLLFQDQLLRSLKASPYITLPVRVGEDQIWIIRFL
ncbi:MAG: hypothetical protein DWQ04_13510 [Chloroflexi bacterium]|nr:MAG: hypothetical protein DWQ04_13510 [Chloroflexota bacterium]